MRDLWTLISSGYKVWSLILRNARDIFPLEVRCRFAYLEKHEPDYRLEEDLHRFALLEPVYCSPSLWMFPFSEADNFNTLLNQN